MKKVLFISNIPAPYRIDFFNALGQVCELTVVFEAKRAAGVRFNWNEDQVKHFRSVFLSEGDIQETHINRRVFRYIKRGAYDHIVATSYGYYTETAALIKMRLLNIPYDIEIDGGVVRSNENLLKRLVKRLIIRGATRLFSSGAAADEVFLHYGASSSRLVRYPFTSLHTCDLLTDVPSFAQKQSMKKMLGIPYHAVVLSIGQFIHRKGYDVLLPICGQLARETGVYIIGGLPTQEYQRIINDYELSNVHFLSFMNKTELSHWLFAADVFVLPTREDMWGLVINEAMANALPVITTDHCNAGLELVKNGKNGYLVPIENGMMLLARIKEVLASDSLRTQFSTKSLEMIAKYTIEQMVQVHQEAFDAERT
ncbi:MAG: glycosyltransferase [Clostridia bacterium]